ncbi:hypothetical protein HBI29_007570 [Parastagonospora nodorum]|nr:hypothetical protein HBI29_007570 [Parastagonospora nodorum]
MSISSTVSLVRFCITFTLLLYVTGIDASPSLVSIEEHRVKDDTSAYEAEHQKILHRLQPLEVFPPLANHEATNLPDHRSDNTRGALTELRDALSNMQDQYFSLWLGKWTSAIDWTAAVTNTYISATLSSLTRSHDVTSEHSQDGKELDNDINMYFAQTTAFYYGEEAFAIRMQAYDDILWVVLEWLESIKFINEHSSTQNQPWHAQQFIPAFSHRARIFYQLSEAGWDWRLCGGGMTWNPRLLPYKNAITNQLFIAASASMYLHFPGDDNCSPFLSASNECSRRPHDPAFLKNAIDGYTWLNNSGMRNPQGLYTDGFHISGYRSNRSKTTCDERNEMVYTYNQGVILSGLRDLFAATGNAAYLSDAFVLIANVVRATGWGRKDGKWAGLGRNGVLEDFCDARGTCNQDGQTFKGVFWNHLVAFCRPLGLQGGASEEVHGQKCKALMEWVVWNAKAALRTRDRRGRFGEWWSAARRSNLAGGDEEGGGVLPDGAVDYRNYPALLADWKKDEVAREDVSQHSTKPATSGDPSSRGRGRTVETQGSGLSVVRAMYEFLKLSEKES